MGRPKGSKDKKPRKPGHKGIPHTSNRGFHPCLMSAAEFKVYAALGNMHGHCYNPKCFGYKNYGGRGLTIDPRYSLSPEGMNNLIADIGLPPTMKHEIDRYPENDAGYLIGNIRWATRSQQNANRRKYTISREGRAAIGAAQLGKKRSAETRAAQSALRLGKKNPASGAARLGKKRGPYKRKAAKVKERP